MDQNARGPVTLGDLRREGRLLWCYCRDCAREVEVPPGEIALDDAVPVPEAGRRLTCSACGGRNVETKPQLHARPIAEIRAAAQKKQGRDP